MLFFLKLSVTLKKKKNNNLNMPQNIFFLTVGIYNKSEFVFS